MNDNTAIDQCSSCGFTPAICIVDGWKFCSVCAYKRRIKYAEPPFISMPQPTDPKGTVKYEVEVTKTPWEIHPLTDPKGAAGKLKDQLQLIPTILEKETAKALANGAKKYQPFNWRFSQVEAMTYIGAIRRHLNAYFDGEELDPESGAHHLGHIAANCAILMDAEDQGTLIDNRPVNNKPKP